MGNGEYGRINVIGEGLQYEHDTHDTRDEGKFTNWKLIDQVNESNQRYIYFLSISSWAEYGCSILSVCESFGVFFLFCCNFIV